MNSAVELIPNYWVYIKGYISEIKQEANEFHLKIQDPEFGFISIIVNSQTTQIPVQVENQTVCQRVLEAIIGVNVRVSGRQRRDGSVIANHLIWGSGYYEPGKLFYFENHHE